MPKGEVMDRKTSNRFIMAGVAIVIAGILLMESRYPAMGIVGNILQGAKVLETGIEVRWPLLAGLGLICWGIYRRLNSN